MPSDHGYATPCPADRATVTEFYFMEHRAKLIDLAAFLDRVDRSEGEDDFRIDAFRSALSILSDAIRPSHLHRGIPAMICVQAAKPSTRSPLVFCSHIDAA